MAQTTQFGVLWDMDGTLVDSAELHYNAWVTLAEEIGRPFSRADFAATFGRRNPEIIRQVFDPAASDEEVDRLGNRKEELYRAQARRGVALLPGVRELLEGLHAAGFKQAIASSAPRANLDLILQLTHIEPYIDAVVSMEETERGKPDPQVFLVAAVKLGLPPQRCMVVEDAIAGVEAARAGGMKCIAVTFVGHHDPARLKVAGADLVVPNLDEVSVATIRELFRSLS
jgi:beta-phosphoglucomutase